MIKKTMSQKRYDALLQTEAGKKWRHDLDANDAPDNINELDGWGSGCDDGCEGCEECS